MDHDNEEVKELLRTIDLHVQAGFVAIVTLARIMAEGKPHEPYPLDIAENVEFINRIADSLRSTQPTETR